MHTLLTYSSVLVLFRFLRRREAAFFRRLI